MANSGIYWIDITFDWSVNLLYKVAGLLGISYEEINIWLFVIIGPISLLISIFLNYYFYKKTKKLKKIIEIQKQEISEINEAEVEEKKTNYLKIFGIIILIRGGFYVAFCFLVIGLFVLSYFSKSPKLRQYTVFLFPCFGIVQLNLNVPY